MSEGTSMLDMNFDDVVEYEAVEPGEYQLRIEDIEQTAGDKGPYIKTRLCIVGNDTAKDISHVMMLPQQSDDFKKRNNRMLAIRNFYDAFGIDYKSGPVNLADTVGSTGWAMLKLESSDDFGDQNRVRRWVTGA